MLNGGMMGWEKEIILNGGGEELLREESLGCWANETNWHNRANSFI